MKLFTLPLLLFMLVGITINTQGQSIAYNYNNVVMGGGGFVSGIITCPTKQNLIYARTDVGGAYRWEETNKSWIPLTDWVADDQVGFLGVESIAIDPSAPEKVYMLVGIDYFNSGKTAVLRSNDYGATFAYTDVTSKFKAHGNGMGRGDGERLAVDPNKGTILFCGTRRNGLFKSTDGGVSWSSVSALPVTTTANDNGICFILFDKTTGTAGNATQTIYAGVSRFGNTNIYESKDGGTTWNALAGQTTTYAPQHAVLASDGNLFITYGNGAAPSGNWNLSTEPMDNGQVWKFNTKTSVWTNITPVVAGTTMAFSGVSVDATAQKVIVTSTNKYMQQPWGWGDRIFVSTNGGSAWTDIIGTSKVTMDNNGMSWIDNHALHWASSIELDPYNSNRAFVTSGNGIFMTDNLSSTATSTWKFMTKGLEETVPLGAVSIPGGPFVSVIGDYDGSTYTDITKSTPTHNLGMGSSTGIAYATKNISFIVRSGGASDGSNFPIYYTNNSGLTWTAFASKPAGTPYQGRVGVSADGLAVLWCSSGSTTTYRTANNGTSWTTCIGLTVNTMPVGDEVNVSKMYAYNSTSGYMMVSIDKGITFTQAGSAGTGGSQIIRTAPGIEGDVWVALNTGGLTRSKNSGTSFTKIAGISYCRSVGFGKAATGKTFPSVYIWGKANGVTTNGIYRSDDEGTTWVRINDDTHQFGGPGNGEFVIGDMNVYGRVYMSTAGRGIVYGDPAGTATCQVPSLGNDMLICETSTINLNLGITDSGYTYIWKKDGMTLTNKTQTLDVTKSGSYSVTITKSGCSDASDEIIISSNLLSVQDDTICNAGITTLSVLSAGGPFEWYADASGNSILSTGTSYSPTINSSTSFYIKDGGTVSSVIGKTIKDADATGWRTTAYTDLSDQLIVIVTKAITLESVAVQNEDAGNNITLRLLNGTTVAYTYTASNQAAGLKDIPVNFNLAPGSYTMDAVGTTGGLFLQTNNAVFPYSVNGYISFSNAQSWATGWYGHFYNWKLKVGNACARTPINAVIDAKNINCTTTEVEDASSINFSVYPNPAKDIIMINYKLLMINENHNNDIKIINTLGQTVFNSLLIINHSPLIINTSQFPSGLYFIKIGDQIQKLIKH